MWNFEFLALVICAFLSNASAAVTSLERGKTRHKLMRPLGHAPVLIFVTGSQSGSQVCFDITMPQRA